MRRGIYSIYLFLIFSLNICVAKEVLHKANYTVKQTKFDVHSGELVFIEKYQNINGKVTENWFIDNQTMSKDEYYKKMTLAEKEEEEIAREQEERKRREEEERNRELLEKKKQADKEFIREARLQTLKKLVSLELESVEKSFARLDRYQLDQYFVFEETSFSSLESLHESKVALVSLARELNIRPLEEIEDDELKDVLARLETVPDKVERFFRQSVKYAINQCNDTKRLKELLALI